MTDIPALRGVQACVFDAYGTLFDFTARSYGAHVMERGAPIYSYAPGYVVMDGPANITRAAKRNLRSAPVSAGAEFGAAEQRLDRWKDGSPRWCGRIYVMSVSISRSERVIAL